MKRLKDLNGNEGVNVVKENDYLDYKIYERIKADRGELFDEIISANKNGCGMTYDISVISSYLKITNIQLFNEGFKAVQNVYTLIGNELEKKIQKFISLNENNEDGKDLKDEVEIELAKMFEDILLADYDSDYDDYSYCLYNERTDELGEYAFVDDDYTVGTMVAHA